MKLVSNYLGNRPNLKRLLTSFSYFFSEKVTRIVVGFVLQTWLARHLGPEGMGIFSYITDYVAIFIPIVLFGLDDILVKELVRHSEPGKVLGTVLYFRLGMCVLSWVALAILIIIIRGEAWELVVATIIYGTHVLVRTLDTFYSYFHAHLEIKPLVRGRQIGYGIASVLRAAGLWIGYGWKYFLFNNYLQLVLERLFIIFEFRKINRSKLTFDSSYLATLLPICIPIALTGFFSFAETRLGTFFLSKFSTLETVGEFGVGRGLLDIWDFLPTAICLSAFPIIVNQKNLNYSLYENKLHKLYSGLFYLGLVFALTISFAAPWVIKVLYGERFLQTVTVLTYGSFFAIISYVNIGRVKWYILEEKTPIWLLVCLVTFVLNFFMQFYITKEFGIIGPYIAAILAHALGNMFICFFSPTVRQDLVHVFKGIFFPLRKLRFT